MISLELLPLSPILELKNKIIIFILQDHRLRTPSHCAAAKGQLRMLKLLKQYNASFEIQNYRGDLPFHEAIQTGSKGIFFVIFFLKISYDVFYSKLKFYVFENSENISPFLKTLLFKTKSLISS